jgi:carboxyl-terminal processing protease
VARATTGRRGRNRAAIGEPGDIGDLPKRVRFISWSRLFSSARPLGVVLVAVSVAACNTRDTVRDSSTEHLFSRGIEEITELYIDPIPSQKLVDSGVATLAKLDPRLGVAANTGDVRDRNQLTVTYDGIAVGNYQVPPDIGGEAGGEVIAQTIAGAKHASPKIAALPQETVERAVFEGMTGLLDRFSHYAPPEEARDQRAARDGFGGIGVTLETANNDFSISEIGEQSPAERAGIRIGDKIVAIDGEPVAGHRPIDVIRMLRGPVASVVALTIDRPGTAGTRDFKLERALVAMPTVTASRDGSIAIFRIASFNQSTTRRLTERLIEAQRQANGRLSGIVLDLRGNPGGLLDQAVSLSDLFIAKGPIIATAGRHPASHQYFAATGHAIAPTTPLVVLVNGGSASASEIVAAALQDVGRAVVIGSASYGKGTVQTVMRLPNDGELTLTWARLVTPSGYFLQRHGVVPTLCTDGLADSDSAVDVALHQNSVEASRPRASLDEQGWTMLRKSCAPEQTSPAIDLKLAERVLSDPARYSAALGAIHPASVSAQVPAPAALTAGNGGLSSGPR